MSALYVYAVSQVHPNVLKHLPTATWMTDMTMSSRRTGRTTICALALLRQAVENPGTTVRYVDHTESGKSHVRDIIQGWIHKSGFDRTLHYSDNNGFCITDNNADVMATDESAVEPDETLLRAFRSLLDAGYTRDELQTIIDQATVVSVHDQ